MVLSPVDEERTRVRMPSRRVVTACPLLLGVMVLVGCVGPARTLSSYEKKAANTAEDARSAVETARLGAEAGTRRRAFGPYLSVLLADAEEQASSVQTTFDSIQPPDEDADDLRTELDELLTDATDVLADLRIAARRGELADLVRKAHPLARLSEKLEAFAEAHG